MSTEFDAELERRIAEDQGVDVLEAGIRAWLGVELTATEGRRGS